MRKLLTAAMLAGLLLCAAPLTAHADAPPQVAALCSDAPNGCSLRHDAWMRDGATYSVVVTGNPGVRVEVVVYLATVENGTVTGLSPLITGNEVLTDSSGVARATVTIPPITDGRPGGWALVSLGGVTAGDLAAAIGGFVAFGSRNPTSLGDGYGDVKPAGAILDLHLVGTIPGSQFAVDYADDEGVWREATVDGDAANQPTKRPDEVAIVRYQMPRGLTAAPHAFRLRNVTAGSSDTTWLATPGTKGTESARAEWPVPSPPGERVADAAQLVGRPTVAVKAVAGGIGGAALLVVLVATQASARKRRLR